MISVAALLAVLAAAEPCLSADAAGRPFRTCFDPGNRLELGAAALGGDAGAGPGGAALDLSSAWRWRGDTRTRAGRPEWLREQALLDGGATWRGGRVDAARVVAWRGTFLRRLAEPFVLLPGAVPTRLPFPFDVGVAAEAGGVRWQRGPGQPLEVEVVRTALLLDVARGRRPFRRAAFGPELAYGLEVARGRAPIHALVPFSGGVVDLLAESADGLWLGALSARGGAVLQVPGRMAPFLTGALRLERVVLAVNDQPLALALEGRLHRGPGPDRAEALVGLRLALDRARR